MALNIQSETVVTATTGTTADSDDKTELQTLHATAERLATQLPWLPRVPSSDVSPSAPGEFERRSSRCWLPWTSRLRKHR